MENKVARVLLRRLDETSLKKMVNSLESESEFESDKKPSSQKSKSQSNSSYVDSDAESEESCSSEDEMPLNSLKVKVDKDEVSNGSGKISAMDKRRKKMKSKAKLSKRVAEAENSTSDEEEIDSKIGKMCHKRAKKGGNKIRCKFSDASETEDKENVDRVKSISKVRMKNSRKKNGQNSNSTNSHSDNSSLEKENSNRMRGRKIRKALSSGSEDKVDKVNEGINKLSESHEEPGEESLVLEISPVKDVECELVRNNKKNEKSLKKLHAVSTSDSSDDEKQSNKAKTKLALMKHVKGVSNKGGECEKVDLKAHMTNSTEFGKRKTNKETKKTQFESSDDDVPLKSLKEDDPRPLRLGKKNRCVALKHSKSLSSDPEDSDDDDVQKSNKNNGDEMSVSPGSSESDNGLPQKKSMKLCDSEERTKSPVTSSSSDSDIGSEKAKNRKPASRNSSVSSDSDVPLKNLNKRNTSQPKVSYSKKNQKLADLKKSKADSFDSDESSGNSSDSDVGNQKSKNIRKSAPRTASASFGSDVPSKDLKTKNVNRSTTSNPKKKQKSADLKKLEANSSDSDESSANSSNSDIRNQKSKNIRKPAPRAASASSDSDVPLKNLKTKIKSQPTVSHLKKNQKLADLKKSKADSLCSDESSESSPDSDVGNQKSKNIRKSVRRTASASSDSDVSSKDLKTKNNEQLTTSKKNKKPANFKKLEANSSDPDESSENSSDSDVGSKKSKNIRKPAPRAASASSDSDVPLKDLNTKNPDHLTTSDSKKNQKSADLKKLEAKNSDSDESTADSSDSDVGDKKSKNIRKQTTRDSTSSDSDVPLKDLKTKQPTSPDSKKNQKSADLKKSESDNSDSNEVTTDDPSKHKKPKSKGASSSDSDSERSTDNKTNTKVKGAEGEDSGKSGTSSSDESDPDKPRNTDIREETGLKSREKEKKRGSNKRDGGSLESLKKYLRLCGYRVQNYDTFFKGCNTTSAKQRKIKSILEELGVEGRPSIAKCRKARMKLEKKKEIEELDMGNIIESEGRSRRSAPTRAQKRSASPVHEDFSSRFKRLRGFVESDSD